MKRVLVIEDDQSVRGAVSRILRLGGYEPIEAVDGRDGLDVFIRHAFIAVVTDLFMPEQEGIETIQRIRELDSSIPIIAISGAVEMGFSALEDAQLIGANAVLSKPFGIEDLLGALEEAIERAPPPQSKPSAASLSAGKVLVIDDDEDVRGIMCHMLERNGAFEVVSASSGADGIDAFVRNHCIAVVTDLIMPDRTGIETIKHLRDLDRRVPIIAVTGFAWDDDSPLTKEARDAGADRILGKPFRPHELLEAIGDLLKRGSSAA